MIQIKLTRQENAEFYGAQIGDVIREDLETYVAGVVASEVGNSSLEACKAQAVAARTFAVSKGVLDGKPITDSSSKDQAYRAARVHSGLYPNAKQAAQETAGEILTYQGKPINAVYSASNGGRTVSSQEKWGGVRPYLIAQDDPWDNSEKVSGHGVGMSQRGAKAMASAGKGYREILAFYYPGTEIAELEKGGEEMVNALEFIRKVRIPLEEGWGYIYGQWGALWTKEKQAAATREMTVKYGSKWIGHMVTDCSGLVYWALKQLSIETVHHATYLYTNWCKVKGKMLNGKRIDGEAMKPGSLVFLKGSEEKIHHVGVYVGNGEVIEAKGTQSGVILSDLSRWDYWGELKVVDYTNNTFPEPALSSDTVRAILDKNPNTYVNVRNAPSAKADRMFQLAKGSIVDILSQDQGWIQIRYGGRIGWASAEYFTVMEAKPEIPPVEEEYYTDEETEDEPGLPDSSLLDELIEIRSRLDHLIGRLGGIVG